MKPTQESVHIPAFRRALPRALGVLVAGLALAASAQSPSPSPGPSPKSVNQLKAFFQQNCIRCHGADGSAHNAEGKKLSGLDFTKAARDFSALNGPAADREIRAMVHAIQKGLFFGLSMPAWKDQLSEEDSTLMVREVLLKAEPGKPIQPQPETGGGKPR
ncbi:hypothetical protein GETHLI_20100 [Geothrix limicola]|uniref:Cytochrome c domain-containing protein n=1 Tax=Geothrix limicola TaxID=2927978 RepID=A0ABQ5QFP2_9BACT|nr:cytochrome c [Geothrix limicola]GLH73508.1 hypothetical protein GETHLI_20100 [Geothrix limicola]